MNIIDMTEQDPANHQWLKKVSQGKQTNNAESHASFEKPEYNEGSEVVPEGSGMPEVLRENGPDA